MKKVIAVEGMMCEHCQAHVTEALQKVPGVTEVQVSLKKKNAEVVCEKEVADEVLQKAVTDAGYQPGKVDTL